MPVESLSPGELAHANECALAVSTRRETIKGLRAQYKSAEDTKKLGIENEMLSISLDMGHFYNELVGMGLTETEIEALIKKNS